MNPPEDPDFVMLDRRAAEAAYAAMRRLGPFSLVGRRVLDAAIFNLEVDAANVAVDRTKLAELVGTNATTLSSAMVALSKLGIVERYRAPIAGRVGSGPTAYFVSPRIAWRGSVESWREARREAPPLPFVTPG